MTLQNVAVGEIGEIVRYSWDLRRFESVDLFVEYIGNNLLVDYTASHPFDRAMLSVVCHMLDFHWEVTRTRKRFISENETRLTLVTEVVT